VPDIVSPDTVPVYVTAVEPTVPNVMVLPVTVPVRGTVPDVDRWIVPASFPDDSVHVRSKVPVKAPLYVPDHLPVRGPAWAAAGGVELGVDAGVEAAEVFDAAAAGADELGVPDPLLHPDASTTGSSTTAAARRGRVKRVRMAAAMRLPFRRARRRPRPSHRSVDRRAMWTSVSGTLGRILGVCPG
jgi:hypothetical protein